MKRKNKREFVLDIYDQEAMGEVTAREIAVINQALIAEYGEGGAMDPGEIARVLIDEDLPVRFDQIFRMATHREKYENVFAHLPQLDGLAQAARSIAEIDALHRKFARRGDPAGMRYARLAAQEGQQTARENADDARNDLHARQEQAEIAQWFTVWLQTPTLFAQWLELRQATPEYRQKFETK